MNIKIPFLKTYSHKCKDGRRIVVYKDVNYIYPLYIAKKTSKMKTKVKDITQNEVEFSTENESGVDKALFELDQFNNSLIMNLRTAYISFQMDPCGNQKKFEKISSRIQAEQNKLNELKAHLLTLIKIAGQNPNNSDKYIELLSKIYDDTGIGKSSLGVISASVIKETRDIAVESWSGDKNK